MTLCVTLLYGRPNHTHNNIYILKGAVYVRAAVIPKLILAHYNYRGHVKNKRPSRKSSVVVHQSVRRLGAVLGPFVYIHHTVRY